MIIKTLALEDPNASALKQYLWARGRSFQSWSGPKYGEIELQNLEQDINKARARIDEFATSTEIHSDSQLVLGKVQSGKTAHLLGLIASLVETKISFVILISGSTGALDRQTQLRLREDLESLNGSPIRVFGVPTLAKLKKTNVVDDISILVKRRIDAFSRTDALRMPPLPVLAVLESKARVESVREIVEELGTNFGKKFNVVIIDDEADQISQNSRSRSRKKSKIYEVLEQIRTSTVRNCLLSYTATPQSVLLTDKNSVLRPRLCTVIATGSQYYGLSDLMSDEAAVRRIDVDDIDGHLEDAESPPTSFGMAILEFLIAGLIRRECAEVFYSSDGRFSDVSLPEYKSVQMLIHPSGRQLDHRKFHDWARKILNEIQVNLGEGYLPPRTDFVAGELATAYRNLKLRMGSLGGTLPLQLPLEWITNLSQSVANSTKILIVNSDADSPTSDLTMPSRPSDWETSENWILIGGDILGRGVTIHQLVTTYFLRNPKTPQFDTLSQQMRFCGYRARYSKLLCVWAPSDVFDGYVEMDQAGHVLYRYANIWDEKNQDLKRVSGRAAFVGNMVPTRKGVWDPNLHLAKSTTEPFQIKQFSQPFEAAENAKFVMHCVDEYRSTAQELTGDHETWKRYGPFGAEEGAAFLLGLTLSASDIKAANEASILFDLELGALGLSGLEVNLLVRNLDFVIRMANRESLRTAGQYRTCSGSSVENIEVSVLRQRWFDAYGIQEPSIKAEWYGTTNITPQIGGAQRALRELPEFRGRSVLLIAEPFDLVKKRGEDLVKPKDNGELENLIGYGFAISMLVPDRSAVSYWTM
jgi:hypothetical protein